MSDSKRKSTGFQDSLSKGSTEDFDVCCDPCLLAGQHAEAKGFCQDCQENLCKTCLEYHNKIKASRHHKIQSQLQTGNVKTPVQQDFSMSCTEPCQVHQSEVIKFFCPKHEAVGCADCMTLDHRTCKLDYIPDICAGITKSHEFQKTLKEVAKTIKEAVELGKWSKLVKVENKTSLEEALRKIDHFQKNVNDRLEQLKRNMMQEAQKERSMHDGNVDKVLHTTDHVAILLSSFQSVLQDSQSKNLNAKAYIVMKQTQSMMKSSKLESAGEELSLHRMKYVFEPNEDLENVLLTTDGLGKLNIYTEQIVAQKNKSFKLMCIEKDINVRTKSDKKTCYISGCAVISPERILLADHSNMKLKVLDIGQQSVIEEETLDLWPLEVAALPQNKVAVTTAGKILLFEISGKISTIRSTSINSKWCCGITYHQDRIYVVCQLPNSLLVLDMQGTIQRDFSLQAAITETFSDPVCITSSRDGRTLYVTDIVQSFVACITEKGEVISVYKNSEMKGPRGLVVIEDGSLLVCCYESGTIHQVSSDLKHGHTLTKGVTEADSICYQPDSQKIFVGREKCDSIQVFTMK